VQVVVDHGDFPFLWSVDVDARLSVVDSLVNNPVPAGPDVIVRVHILFSCSMTPYCEIRIRRRAPAAPMVNARDIAAILLVC
jgi:hypothetical protein